MNKLLLTTLFAGTIASAGELVNPTYAYELDTWGSNSEVYEFTSKANPNYTCIVFILDNLKATGLQCFPKPTK